MSIIHIFNTHRWKQDSSENQTIRDWLRSDYYYVFKFYEISKLDHSQGKGIAGPSNELKNKIKNRIKSSSVILAFNNQSVSYDSTSVHAYEIREAKRQGKPIVLVNKRGTSSTPSIYNGYENLINVNWNRESIREAIKKAR